MRTTRFTRLLGVGVWMTALTVFAGSAVDVSASDKSEVEVKLLVTNLDNPSGVAIQPETGKVFVSSRYGIYRYDSKDHKVNLEILSGKLDKDGNGPDIYGKGPKYNIGPLGVAVLGKDQLVVGDGSRPDGEELLRIYKIGAKPAATSLKEDSGKTFGPIKAGEQSIKGEGNFYGVAIGAGGIFVTCNGDDTKGWIAKLTLKDGKPEGALTLMIATKVATDLDAPVAITFSPDGKDLVVGQMGEMDAVGDSLLTTYDPATGKLKSKLKTGLSDIAGLAYSPKTKKLYAVDFSWADTKKGGLFRLDIEGDKVTATKIVALDKPTALAFDSDGKLYITQFGTQDEKKKEFSPGTLSVIDAGL